MRELNITIPEPCHEDWNTMTPTEKGKFCNSCTKEVFDFTHYSDEQLIKRFEKEGDLCGRFTTNQLNRDLVLQRKKNHNYISYAFTGFLSLLLLNSNSSKAQDKQATIQTDKKFTSIPLQNTRVTDSITVSGIVFDETNIPLPGATIIIKGTVSATATDYEGKFSLNCSINDTLEVNYVGYKNILFKAIKNNSVKLNLEFDPETVSTGIVITAVSNKRWIGANLFTRFTNIFRKDNKNAKYRF